jgi:hypothetical protein
MEIYRSPRLDAEVNDGTTPNRARLRVAEPERFIQFVFDHPPIGFARIEPTERRYININDAFTECCAARERERERGIGRQILRELGRDWSTSPAP